jgi:hypothetical protein
MLVTLTPRAGGAEEQRFTLRPNDVSTMITIPTGQFNQRFDTPVHHPGGARVVMGQQEKKLKVRPEESHLARLIDVWISDTKVVEDNRQLASCWPPMGTCASCGMEGYRHLRAPCIAQGRRCHECGSEDHLARACKTRQNSHVQGMEFDAIHRGIHSCRNPSTRRDGANKKQKTQHDEFSGNDNTRTTGVDDLPDGKNRANPTPKSTPRDQIDGN